MSCMYVVLRSSNGESHYSMNLMGPESKLECLFLRMGIGQRISGIHRPEKARKVKVSSYRVQCSAIRTKDSGNER